MQILTFIFEAPEVDLAKLLLLYELSQLCISLEEPIDLKAFPLKILNTVNLNLFSHLNEHIEALLSILSLNFKPCCVPSNDIINKENKPAIIILKHVELKYQ